MEQHIINTIKHIGEPIRAKGATGLYVYGSRARGDHWPESDIDIIVDYDPATDFSIVEAELLLIAKESGIEPP